MSAKENKYQRDLIKKISRLLPGSLVLKNDPNYIQGIPDLMILHGDMWAMLEVKASRLAKVQPNQEYYVNQLTQLGFARFIYPENEQEVFNDLLIYFGFDNAVR
nr:MAG TPA: hydrolase [Caudoviricetes sp.]